MELLKYAFVFFMSGNAGVAVFNASGSVHWGGACFCILMAQYVIALFTKPE